MRRIPNQNPPNSLAATKLQPGLKRHKRMCVCSPVNHLFFFFFSAISQGGMCRLSGVGVCTSMCVERCLSVTNSRGVCLHHFEKLLFTKIHGRQILRLVLGVRRDCWRTYLSARVCVPVPSYYSLFLSVQISSAAVARKCNFLLKRLIQQHPAVVFVWRERETEG